MKPETFAVPVRVGSKTLHCVLSASEKKTVELTVEQWFTIWSIIQDICDESLRSVAASNLDGFDPEEERLVVKTLSPILEEMSQQLIMNDVRDLSN